MPPSASRAVRLAGPLALALLAALALTTRSVPAFAETPAGSARDSLAAAPDTSRVAPSSERTLRVYLEKGGVLTAVRVQPLAHGLLRITLPDGTTKHVSANRVKRVVDERGMDLTRSVVGEDRSGAAGGSRAPEGVARDWDAARFQARVELGYGNTKLRIDEVVSDSGSVSRASGEYSRDELHASFGAGYRLGRWGSGAVQPDLIAFGSFDPSVETETYGQRTNDSFGLVLQGGLEAGVRLRTGAAHHLRLFTSAAPGIAVVRSIRYRDLYQAGDTRWTARLGVEWESSRDPVSFGMGIRRLWRGTEKTAYAWPTISYVVRDRYSATDTHLYLLVRSRFLF